MPGKYQKRYSHTEEFINPFQRSIEDEKKRGSDGLEQPSLDRPSLFLQSTKE
jgi:hypothetical protein